MTELLERIEETEADAPPRSYVQALASLKKGRDFSAPSRLRLELLWVVWAVVYAFGGPIFPWPIFPLFGWGIGLTFHAWDVYGRKPFRDEDIEREAARLAR